MNAGLEHLDPVIHAPKRLAAMAVLASSSDTDFGFLRDHLQISDSDLSKQMGALEAAGYVSIAKHGRGRGSATTYKITKSGAAAYAKHIKVLQAMISG